jgi:hypothetical protein
MNIDSDLVNKPSSLEFKPELAGYDPCNSKSLKTTTLSSLSGNIEYLLLFSRYYNGQTILDTQPRRHATKSGRY